MAAAAAGSCSLRRGCRCSRSRPSEAAAAPTARAGTPRHMSRAAVACGAAFRCHYEVLGVAPSATADEVKAAFRGLALRLHPDVNPSPGAVDAFKTARAAYEVLADPKKRAEYNKEVGSRGSAAARGRAARQQQQRRQGQGQGHAASAAYGFWGDVRDLFDDEEEGDWADDVFGGGGGGSSAEPEAAGFYGWYQRSGSWQSSWQANQRKRRRRQEEEQRHQQRQRQEELQQLLRGLDAEQLAAAQQVFGRQLEGLGSTEELRELLVALEMLRAEGITFDPSMWAGRQHSRGSGSSGSRGSSSSSCRTNDSSQKNRSSSSSSSRQAAGRRSTGDAGSRASGAAGRGAGRGGGRPRATGRSRVLPRFDEMGFEELVAAMEDVSDPAGAAAARAWARSYAARGGAAADPHLAALLGGLFTLEFLTSDWGEPPAEAFGDLGAFAWRGFGGGGGGSGGGSGSSGEDSEDEAARVSERWRHRAKPGSPRDYVMWDGDDEDWAGGGGGGGASEDEDDGEAALGAAGWLDLDEIVFEAGGWWADSDDDEGGGSGSG